jgi:hypothetical protein
LLFSGAVMGAGGSVVLLIGGCGSGEEPYRIELTEVLLQPDRVRPIGEEFRRQFPADVDRRALERRVFDGLPGMRAIDLEVNQRLAELIRQDFEAERVFLFEGWILSHTEGHLSALVVI